MPGCPVPASAAKPYSKGDLRETYHEIGRQLGMTKMLGHAPEPARQDASSGKGKLVP
jgi:hypothetical protein